jgi:hypothetical protein
MQISRILEAGLVERSPLQHSYPTSSTMSLGYILTLLALHGCKKERMRKATTIEELVALE